MSDRDSPIMLKGALVGGPDQEDAYPNERNDYKRSEVALDYQVRGGYFAGWGGALYFVCVGDGGGEWGGTGGALCLRMLLAACARLAPRAAGRRLTPPPLNPRARPQAGFTGAAAGLAALDAESKLGRRCSSVTKKPAKRLPDYSLCGGEGNACPADLKGKCVDAPWPGYACAPGQRCERRNHYAHVCVGAVPQ